MGSLNYVADHAEELGTIRAVFSLDSLGACKMVATSVRTGNATDLFQLLNLSASSLGLSIQRVAYSGDHTSFQDPLSILDWSLGATQVLRDKLSQIKQVGESIGVGSSPAFQRDLWQWGQQGWIHTTYDNSTTALRENWVTPQNLELQTKAVTLTIIKMGEKWMTAMVLLGFFVGRVAFKQGKKPSLSPLVKATRCY